MKKFVWFTFLITLIFHKNLALSFPVGDSNADQQVDHDAAGFSGKSEKTLHDQLCYFIEDKIKNGPEGRVILEFIENCSVRSPQFSKGFKEIAHSSGNNFFLEMLRNNHDSIFPLISQEEVIVCVERVMNRLLLKYTELSNRGINLRSYLD